MSIDDGSARFGRAQVLVVREPARTGDLVRVARRVEVVVAALATAAVVVWVMTHLVAVVCALGLIGYAAKLAGRLVRF